MPAIKPLTSTSDKWKRVTSSAGREYQEGVENPKKDWMTETSRSEKAYEQGVQNAIANKSFGNGVKSAGTGKWKEGAINKGVARFAQGVTASGDAYVKGFQPYHEVISNTTLPARGAKGDPANIQRVAVMADALHKKKVQMKGGK